MKSIGFFCLAFIVAASAHAALIVIDSSAPEGGDGSIERPYRTVAAALAASHESDVLYLTPESKPYAEPIALKTGQKLVGSPSDTLLRSRGLDFSATTENATVQGGITLATSNEIAGLTVIADQTNGVSGSGNIGKLLIRDVHFKTSKGMFGLRLSDYTGDAAVNGGGLEATQDGGGIEVLKGNGNLFFDQFPMTGIFSTAVRVTDHVFGPILFREGCEIRVDDSREDAIFADNVGSRAPLRFNAGFSIHSSRGRGIAASHVGILVVAGNATISTTNAAAIDLTDSGGDLALTSVTADGPALQRGIRMVRFRGRARIDGGAVRGATADAIQFEQSSGIDVTGMTIDGSGGIVASGVSAVTFKSLIVRRAKSVSLTDLTGAVLFDQSTLAAPVVIEQHSKNGSVTFERCAMNGGTVTASAQTDSRLTFAVHGGTFQGTRIALNASESAHVCTDIGGVRFTPAENAIRIDASGSATVNVAGARSADASAVRTSIAEANKGATVSINVPAASLSNAARCD